MLVLTRKQGEAIVVDQEVSIRVIEIRGNKVRLGIQAGGDVEVDREEVWLRKVAGAASGQGPAAEAA